MLTCDCGKTLGRGRNTGRFVCVPCGVQHRYQYLYRLLLTKGITVRYPDPSERK